MSREPEDLQEPEPGDDQDDATQVDDLAPGRSLVDADLDEAIEPNEPA